MTSDTEPSFPHTEVLLCRTCGKRLTSKQITVAKAQGRKPIYCSYPCSKHNYNAHSIKEPTNSEELREVQRVVKERRDNLRRDEKDMIRSLSPPEDDPVAERKLRERVCPNPPDYIYASTGTANGRGF